MNAVLSTKEKSLVDHKKLLTFSEAVAAIIDSQGSVNIEDGNLQFFFINGKFYKRHLSTGAVVETTVSSMFHEAKDEEAKWVYSFRPTFGFSQALYLLKENFLVAREKNLKDNELLYYSESGSVIQQHFLNLNSVFEPTPQHTSFSSEDVTANDWFIVPTKLHRLGSVSVSVYS